MVQVVECWWPCCTQVQAPPGDPPFYTHRHFDSSFNEEWTADYWEDEADRFQASVVEVEIGDGGSVYSSGATTFIDAIPRVLMKHDINGVELCRAEAPALTPAWFNLVWTGDAILAQNTLSLGSISHYTTGCVVDSFGEWPVTPSNDWPAPIQGGTQMIDTRGGKMDVHISRRPSFVDSYNHKSIYGADGTHESLNFRSFSAFMRNFNYAVAPNGSWFHLGIHRNDQTENIYYATKMNAGGFRQWRVELDPTPRPNNGPDEFGVFMDTHGTGIICTRHQSGPLQARGLSKIDQGAIDWERPDTEYAFTRGMAIDGNDVYVLEVFGLSQNPTSRIHKHNAGNGEKLDEYEISGWRIRAIAAAGGKVVAVGNRVSQSVS